MGAVSHMPFPPVRRGTAGSEIRLFFACLLVYAGIFAYSGACWYGVYLLIRAVA